MVDLKATLIASLSLEKVLSLKVMAPKSHGLLQVMYGNRILHHLLEVKSNNILSLVRIKETIKLCSINQAKWLGKAGTAQR